VVNGHSWKDLMSVPAEMVTLYPVAGAFTHYATRFLDPAFGTHLHWHLGAHIDKAPRIRIGLELLLLLGHHTTW
jgi:hypothetical protein